MVKAFSDGRSSGANSKSEVQPAHSLLEHGDADDALPQPETARSTSLKERDSTKKPCVHDRGSLKSRDSRKSGASVKSIGSIRSKGVFGFGLRTAGEKKQRKEAPAAGRRRISADASLVSAAASRRRISAESSLAAAGGGASAEREASVRSLCVGDAFGSTSSHMAPPLLDCQDEVERSTVELLILNLESRMERRFDALAASVGRPQGFGLHTSSPSAAGMRPVFSGRKPAPLPAPRRLSAIKLSGPRRQSGMAVVGTVSGTNQLLTDDALQTAPAPTLLESQPSTKRRPMSARPWVSALPTADAQSFSSASQSAAVGLGAIRVTPMHAPPLVQPTSPVLSTVEAASAASFQVARPRSASVLAASRRMSTHR